MYGSPFPMPVCRIRINDHHLSLAFSRTNASHELEWFSIITAANCFGSTIDIDKLNRKSVTVVVIIGNVRHSRNSIQFPFRSLISWYLWQSALFSCFRSWMNECGDGLNEKQTVRTSVEVTSWSSCCAAAHPWNMRLTILSGPCRGIWPIQQWSFFTITCCPNKRAY